jgi:hypothetical protein
MVDARTWTPPICVVQAKRGAAAVTIADSQPSIVPPPWPPTGANARQRTCDNTARSLISVPC